MEVAAHRKPSRCRVEHFFKKTGTLATEIYCKISETQKTQSFSLVGAAFNKSELVSTLLSTRMELETVAQWAVDTFTGGFSSALLLELCDSGGAGGFWSIPRIVLKQSEREEK